jgi:hypothetical protein
MFKRRKSTTGKTGGNPLASRVVRGDDRPTEPLPGESDGSERSARELHGPPETTRQAPPALPGRAGRREEPATRLVTPPDGADAVSADGEPLPVGVLLVVRGPGRGSLLPVTPGVNDIGRGAEARIRVDFGDAGIGHERHAVITHDPGSRRFRLQPGTSNTAVTLDGTPLFEATALEDGASLQLGATEFLFHVLPGSHDFESPSG